MYQGAGTYSLLANLGHALSGQDFGERTPYEKVQAQAAIKSTNGAIPEATRNALSSIRPPSRPDGLTPVAQPAIVNPMEEGYKGAATPMGPEDFAPYPKEPLAPAPSVQSEMNLPDPMNYGGGLTMQFGKPIIKDETFFEPFGRPYRKGFSDANQASDMVAPTMAPTTLSSDGGRLQQMKADLSAMGFDPMGFSDADVMELHKLYVGGLVE
jgi:hypothetical protein